MRGLTMPCADHCLGSSLTGSPGRGDVADAFRIASVSAQNNRDRDFESELRKRTKMEMKTRAGSHRGLGESLW